jgi:predicted transcriptional regulator of viral defense system
MTQEERIIELLKGTAFIRSRDLKRHGLSRTALMRLVKKRQAVRARSGLYMRPGWPETEHISLLEVAKKVPGGVICLLTALRFHEIGTQEPYQVWIAIGRKSRRPKISAPVLRVFRFSDASLRYGVEEHEILGTTVRITNPAKTVTDCFKFRNKVGLDVALEAGKDCIRSRKATVSEIYDSAKVCRVANVIRPYLEAWRS